MVSSAACLFMRDSGCAGRYVWVGRGVVGGVPATRGNVGK